MTWFSIDLEAEGDERDSEVLVEELGSALLRIASSDSDVAGPVASWGGLSNGPGATLAIEAPGVLGAIARSLEVWSKACMEVSGSIGPIVSVHAMTEDLVDRWIEERSDELAGVAEIAGMLGVSKQRVGELRDKEGFPTPVAQLASGPVWKTANLKRFTSGWSRKPGRPKKVAPS